MLKMYWEKPPAFRLSLKLRLENLTEASRCDLRSGASGTRQSTREECACCSWFCQKATSCIPTARSFFFLSIWSPVSGKLHIQLASALHPSIASYLFSGSSCFLYGNVAFSYNLSQFNLYSSDVVDLESVLSMYFNLEAVERFHDELQSCTTLYFVLSSHLLFGHFKVAIFSQS